MKQSGVSFARRLVRKAGDTNGVSNEITDSSDLGNYIGKLKYMERKVQQTAWKDTPTTIITVYPKYVKKATAQFIRSSSCSFASNPMVSRSIASKNKSETTNN